MPGQCEASSRHRWVSCEGCRTVVLGQSENQQTDYPKILSHYLKIACLTRKRICLTSSISATSRTNLSDIPTYRARLASRYTVTTHLIPAAFSQASSFIPVPTSPPDNESKEEHGARVQLDASELLSLQAQPGSDNSSTQPRVLWSVVNRYFARVTGLA